MPVENDIIPRVTPGSFRRPQARTPRARWRYSILLIVLTLSVAGCARNAKKDDPSGLTVEGVNLEVRMSSNVFIPPVAPPIPETQRRVYVVGTNTSTIQSANDRLHPLLLQRLAERGYRLTNNPADAHYMLLYNVLYVGKEVQDLSTVTALATGVGIVPWSWFPKSVDKSQFQGMNSPDQLPAAFHQVLNLPHAWAQLARPDFWVGAILGVGMILAAIWLRRWRTET